jgi:glycerate kinase
MSDGGDGFGAVLGGLMGCRKQKQKVIDAAHRACHAAWWWHEGTRTAVLDSAAVIGLAMLPPGRFHPFDLDTFGLGLLLRSAARRGAKRCLAGIGGSATNDGGFGMARALGWEFRDNAGRIIERWTGLGGLARIIPPEQPSPFDEMLVAVDVANPLLGPRGASRVYGPQKGLRPKDFLAAEHNLRRLAEVFRRQSGNNYSRCPGAGAAGGLGFGFEAFLGARLEPGFELFARHAGLERQLDSSDLVLTGEGSVDRSTLMGKGVGELARRCQDKKIPCLGFGGSVKVNSRARSPFAGLYALEDLTTTKEARNRPAYWLEKLATKAAQEYR